MKLCALHTPCFYALITLFISYSASAWIPHLPKVTLTAPRDERCSKTSVKSVKRYFYDSICSEDDDDNPHASEFRPKARVGGWLPTNVEDLDTFLGQVIAAASAAKDNKERLIKPIEDLNDIILQDSVLRENVEKMFNDANARQRQTPLGTKPIAGLETLLYTLNEIVQTAPAFYTVSRGDDTAAGLIGFPINAVLDFPMSTAAGYTVFANSQVNQQFKKILNHWSIFLTSEASTYVLNSTDPEKNPLDAPFIPWVSPEAVKQVVNVAFKYTGKEAPNGTGLEDVFKVVPGHPTLGFQSWDKFFTKEFKEGVRPIGGPSGSIWADSNRVILNACESAPLANHTNVQLDDKFWVKEQPYSIRNILDFDERAGQFAGGTVYQAFLSGLSYHRWHSPVSGTIVKTKVVGGTYYLENIEKGFANPYGPDETAPDASQPFLSAVASRGLIFIEADGPIGLMCFVAVGMSEVSSCDITVKEGQRVKKGEEIGMFHYGGSTHCLLFRDNVNLDFSQVEKKYKTGPFGKNSTNVPVRAQLARVMEDSPAFKSL